MSAGAPFVLPPRVPVFPLPNVVLFPGTILPLHVFEPRYREMIRTALEGDRVLAIALLKPGWERDYYGNPDVHEVACAGRILTEEGLPDGKYNIAVRGEARVRISGFLQEHPFRVAAVSPIPEETAGLSAPGFRREILAFLEAYRTHRSAAKIRIQDGRALDDPGSLAEIVNAVIASLDVAAERRQELLEVSYVAERCRRATRLLGREDDVRAALRKWRRLSRGDPGRN